MAVGKGKLEKKNVAVILLVVAVLMIVRVDGSYVLVA